METFKKLSTETAYLTENLERKKRECIKEKLRYLSQNKDDENAHLTEEEWKILKDYLLKNKDCTSTKMQYTYEKSLEGAEYDSCGYDTIIRIGDKYITVEENEGIDLVLAGYENYEFKVHDKLNVRQEGKQIILNGLYFNIDNVYSATFTLEAKIAGKDELTKPLDIDGLFEHDPFSAVSADSSYPGNESWVDGLNSGLMVIEPNKTVENNLLQMIDTVADSCMKRGVLVGDQDIIKCYLHDWGKCASLHLDEGYNIFADHLTYYIRHLGYSLKGEKGKPIYVVHFIGKSKPWMKKTLKEYAWMFKMCLSNPYYIFVYMRFRKYLKV